jgi:hypothetical protein
MMMIFLVAQARISQDVWGVIGGFGVPLILVVVERATSGWRGRHARPAIGDASQTNGHAAALRDQLQRRTEAQEHRITELERQRDVLESEISRKDKAVVYARRVNWWYETLPEEVKEALPPFPEPRGIEEL